MKYGEVMNWRGDGTEIKFWQTEVPERQAEFAMRLMGNLAIAAAMPAGEDTAGRQKRRLMEPEEVVDRATKIADLAFNRFERLGWLLKLPDPKTERDPRALATSPIPPPAKSCEGQEVSDGK